MTVARTAGISNQGNIDTQTNDVNSYMTLSWYAQIKMTIPFHSDKAALGAGYLSRDRPGEVMPPSSGSSHIVACAQSRSDRGGGCFGHAHHLDDIGA